MVRVEVEGRRGGRSHWMVVGWVEKAEVGQQEEQISKAGHGQVGTLVCAWETSRAQENAWTRRLQH